MLLLEIERKENKKLKSFRRILLLEIEKKEKKNLNFFRNYSSRLARVLSIITAGRVRAAEETFTRKLTKNWAYLNVLVPHINNRPEGAIFRSSKIKEERETMKLQNEETKALV